MLPYRDRAVLEQFDKLHSGMDLSKEEHEEYSLLQSRFSHEEEQNKQELARLIGHESESLIFYGDVIQLQHVTSGLFVSTGKLPADHDQSCRKLRYSPVSCTPNRLLLCRPISSA